MTTTTDTTNTEEQDHVDERTLDDVAALSPGPHDAACLAVPHGSGDPTVSGQIIICAVMGHKQRNPVIMAEQVKESVGKLFSFALNLLFVALGIVGIVLLILPGLVFQFIAALIAARHFPALAFDMERHTYSHRAMRYSHGFMELDG